MLILVLMLCGLSLYYFILFLSKLNVILIVGSIVRINRGVDPKSS